MFVTEAKKKALLDLFISPWTMVPGLIGMSGLIVAWGNDGPLWLGFSGLAGILTAGGISATRFLCSFDKMLQKAWNDLQEKEKQRKHVELRSKYNRFFTEGDQAAANALNDLLAIYDQFNKDVKDNQLMMVAKGTVVEKAKLLFEGCVKSLDHSHELFKKQSSLVGAAQKSVATSRNKELKEVVTSISQLQKVIDQCMDMAKQYQSSSSVSTLADDLEATMNIEKRTQQRMADMGLLEK